MRNDGWDRLKIADSGKMHSTYTFVEMASGILVPFLSASTVYSFVMAEPSAVPMASSEAKALQFVEAYINANFNATQAATQTFNIGSKGGKDAHRTAESMGSEYLRKPEVRRLLERRLREEHADGAFVIEDLLQIAQSAHRDADRLKALELLGKTRAMFTEKQNVEFATNPSAFLTAALKKQATGAKRVQWDRALPDPLASKKK